MNPSMTHPMTPGESLVWAARFSQAQTDIYESIMMKRERSGAEGPSDAEQVDAMKRATAGAIDAAYGAVFTLRAIEVPEGVNGQYLRQIIGAPEPVTIPEPLAFLGTPWDRRLPPPGMMFPDGRTDVVVVAQAVFGEPPEELPLAEAWSRHQLAVDPPGYEIYCYDGDADTWAPRLRLPETDDGHRGAMSLGMRGLAEARALCWRCFDQPHHVSFWVRVGAEAGLELDAVLAWSRDALVSAWGYVLAVAKWRVQEPPSPPFWPKDE